MSRPDPADRMNPHEDAFGAMLRSLPPVEPALDLWPVLAAARQAEARRSLRRRRLFAIAAAIAVVALVPSLMRHGDTHVDPVSPSTTSAHDVPSRSDADELRERSRQLERWLAAAGERAPQDARTLMAVAELEDLVGLVDMQLSAARNDAEALPLWRQRVALLEDLAVTRSVPAALAADGASWQRSTTL